MHIAATPSLVNIFGLDDLAPASGLGSPSFPEPTALSLLAFPMTFLRRRRV